MNNFSLTAKKVKRREPLSYKTLYSLNKKRKLVQTPAAAWDEASDSDSDCSGFECSSQIDNSEKPAEFPEWDISSISNSDEDSFQAMSSDDEEVGLCVRNEPTKELQTQKLYNSCPLSAAQSVNLVQFLSSKHSWTKAATLDVMNLIKMHLPSNVKYPTSMHQFQKSLDIDRNWSTRIFFCRNCKSALLPSYKCPTCSEGYNIQPLVQEGCYFLNFNIKLQFKAILQQEDVQRGLLKKFHQFRESNTFSGIESGRLYIKSKRSRTDLTCSFNVDGVPVFNSSKLSIWPVLLCINELPFNLRKKYVIIAGLWFGQGKPHIPTYLKNIVDSMNQLNVEGINWETVDRVEMFSRVWYNLNPVDTVARCMLQGHIQFNGKFGCTWCENPGRSIAKGLGHCRVYVPNDASALRNDSEYKDRANNHKYSAGQKFRSPLCDLVGFDMVSGFSVDYMHCVFLGVVRSFTQKWLSEAGKEWYIASEILLIDQRYMHLKVPNEIVRTSRNINTLKYWKASEWRTWLFVLPVILKDILPRKFLKHFQLLSRAIFLCSKAFILRDELEEAELKLSTFLYEGEVLYGESFYSFNVHILSHLIKTVRDWGPLWGNSAFQFESFNGKLLKYIKSANGVASQISDKFVIEMQMTSIDQLFTKSELAIPFLTRLTSVSKSETPKFGISRIQTGIPIPLEINQLICSKWRVSNLVTGKIALICRHEFRIKPTTKRCNNILYLGPNKLGKLKHIVKANMLTGDSKEVHIAVVQSFRVKSFKNVPHIYYCKESGNFELEAHELCHLQNKKFFECKMMSKTYYIEVPNLFEID